MTDLRLFFALAALQNKLVFGADVSNAFAEANAPEQAYSMRVDTHFREWWANKGRPPIPAGHVIPILKNLQGHPEAPRQWSKHIDSILQEFSFVPTVHAPCIYRATINGKPFFFYDRSTILPLQLTMPLSTTVFVILWMPSSLFL
jgi:hypothetical protein